MVSRPVMSRTPLRLLVTSAVLLATSVPPLSPEATAGPSRRHLILSGRPETPPVELHVAADNATVLRFEQPVDTAGTKLLNGAQDRFEPLGVAGRSLTLIPRSVVRNAERFSLRVMLENGTVLLLELVVGSPADADGRDRNTGPEAGPPTPAQAPGAG